MYNQQQGAYAQQPQVVYVQQPAPQPLPAAPVHTGSCADMTAQLQQSAQLHASGVLSDAEFAAAKQKLLAG